MKFRVYRTSGFYSEDCPCEGAVQNQETKLWDIDLRSLEELMDLVRKEGEIIVKENTIEIYDDYRE